MRVCVLSDLHLGCGPQNDFRFSDAAFADFLRRQAESCDYLVINGDFVEMWEPKLELFAGSASSVLPQTEGLFRAIRERWPEIFAVVEHTRNIVVLTGNHDALIQLRGWLPKARTELLVPELSLFVAHGHQGDRGWCADDSPCLRLVKCLACCVGYGEALVDPDFDEQVSRVQNLANRGVDGQLADYAFAVAERLGVEIICFGHTHQAELTQRGSKIYVNCGKCVGKSGQVELAVVEDKGAAISVYVGSFAVDQSDEAELRSRAPSPVREAAIPNRKARADGSDQRRLGADLFSDPPGLIATQYSRGALIVAEGRVKTRPGSLLA